MYVIDGIAYASEPVQEMAVVDAQVTGRGAMLVTFSTGETRLLDAAPLMEFPVFAVLADNDVFSNFDVDQGVLTWCDGEVDIATETLYSMSYEYEDVA